MDYNAAMDLLKKYGQEHLLKYYSELDEEGKQSLLHQISRIDFELVDLVKGGEVVPKKGEITPLYDAVSISDIEKNYDRYYETGSKAIREGKVAALLLAGGMGTRLGSENPKGMFNIGITKEVYIFERIISNTLDVVRDVGVWIPLYIMTSERNDSITREFLKEKDYFGYNKDYIRFFVQEMAPACDFSGRIYLEDKGRVSTSPNGNGGWYISMDKAGLREEIKKKKIEYINLFSVDNVLQRIADPLFIGAAIEGGYQSASKVVSKASPEEKVGVLCLEDGKPSIVEYYELTDEMRNSVDESGNLLYRYGVTLNYLFNVNALDKTFDSEMSVHVVKKKIEYIDGNGEKIKPDTENGYKFETLVLDMVHMMDSCLAFEVVRNKEFAPVKNRTGVDSVDTARALLLENGVEI